MELAIVQADGLVEKQLARDAARVARGETREQEIERTYKQDDAELKRKWEADLVEKRQGLHLYSREWLDRGQQITSEWLADAGMRSKRRTAELLEEFARQRLERSEGVEEQPDRKRQRLLRKIKSAQDSFEEAHQELDEMDSFAS